MIQLEGVYMKLSVVGVHLDSFGHNLININFGSHKRGRGQSAWRKLTSGPQWSPPKTTILCVAIVIIEAVGETEVLKL